MPFLQYDKLTAAVHEMGHTTVACIANLDFEHVRIFEDSNLGWRGRCQLVQIKALTPIEIDAFQMAGPLMQVLHREASLGDLASLFTASIFEKANELYWHTDQRLNYIGWDSDLYRPGIMAAGRCLKNSPHAKPGMLPRDWLLGLEVEIRAVFRTPQVSEFVQAISAMLVDCKTVDSKTARQHFNNQVPPDVYKDLVQLLNGHKI